MLSPKHIIVINSASYQFQVIYNKITDGFTVCGIHGFEYQCEDDILEDCNNAQEVVNYLKKWIPTWCIASIVKYTTYSDQSEMICSQMYHSLNENGLFGNINTLKVYSVE